MYSEDMYNYRVLWYIYSAYNYLQIGEKDERKEHSKSK